MAAYAKLGEVVMCYRPLWLLNGGWRFSEADVRRFSLKLEETYCSSCVIDASSVLMVV